MNQPIAIQGRRLNKTLHGRSVYRKADVPGHNVFHGYNTPGRGDGIDFFCAARTKVRAIENCTLMRHYADATKKECIYLEGKHTVAVYAHIDAAAASIGHTFREGEVVGLVRGDLNDPHLHFELEFNGKAVTGPKPENMATNIADLLNAPTIFYRGKPTVGVRPLLINGKLYCAFNPLMSALGLTSYKVTARENTFNVGDPDQSLFSGAFNVETCILDEPGVTMVRVTDVLKPAKLQFEWSEETRHLFIR